MRKLLNNMEEYLWFLLSILFFLLIIFGFFYMDVTIRENRCQQISSEMKVEYKYAPFVGCRIEIEDGLFIPLESYYWKDE